MAVQVVRARTEEEEEKLKILLFLCILFFFFETPVVVFDCKYISFFDFFFTGKT